MVVEADESNFQDHIKTENLVLLDFYTPQCGPCRQLSPLLKDLKNVDVVKINAAENSNLSAQYGVYAVPYLVFLKNGNVVGKHTGFMDLEQLQSKVDGLNKT